ncbi:hypothetical protein [Rheinheimera sp.]|uniref:hypothetical protein n=1 Tax=Rheinheimera sp. TaxID=1869214 RepID=UPI002736502E|nr:hypothetical protein [Rheinheimera sp.]MDP2714689.1 hypothetical protein [Rheinheimera sp.]
MKRFIFVSLLLIISGCTTTLPNNQSYGLEMVSIGEKGETRHIKYNRTTGEAWWASDTAWTKITDQETLPESNYLIRIISTGASWRALRIDTKSGKTWKNSKGKWVPFKE